MRIESIKEKIFPEDKMMVAVSEEVSENYIEKILRGDRDVNSEKSKVIIKKLSKLARLNEKLKQQKKRVVSPETILNNLRTKISKQKV